MAASKSRKVWRTTLAKIAAQVMATIPGATAWEWVSRKGRLELQIRLDEPDSLDAAPESALELERQTDTPERHLGGGS